MSSRVFKCSQVNLGEPYQVIPVIIKQISCENKENNKINNEENEINKMNNEEEKEEKLRIDIIEKIKKEYSAKAEAIIADAKRQAEDIIEQARKQSDDILNNARNEAEIIKETAEKKAYQKGYDEGYRKGKNDADKQYESIIKEAEAIKEQAAEEYKSTIEGMESEIIDIIIQIAKKVVSEELRLNKKTILSMVKEAFAKCTVKNGATLIVSSEDYDFIEEHREELLSNLNSIDNLEVRKDISLPMGTCIIETPYGTIDASVDKKMENIENAINKLTEGIYSKSIA